VWSVVVLSHIAPLCDGTAAFYIQRMSSFFSFLMVLAMVAVLASLGIGLFAMARGGEFSRKYSNKMMRLRVILQGLALVLFAIAMFSRSG
jgi:hypothetical protein